MSGNTGAGSVWVTLGAQCLLRNQSYISDMICYKTYSAGLRSSDLFEGEFVCQRIMKFLSGPQIFLSPQVWSLNVTFCLRPAGSTR